MKFEILVAHAVDSTTEPWWEGYEENTLDPEQWANATIVRFNNTLRPNEKPRKLLQVKICGDENNTAQHQWDKDIKGKKELAKNNK
jgi:hypothetical protein